MAVAMAMAVDVVDVVDVVERVINKLIQCLCHLFVALLPSTSTSSTSTSQWYQL
jgi:hypothetical protein